MVEGATNAPIEEGRGDRNQGYDNRGRDDRPRRSGGQTSQRRDRGGRGERDDRPRKSEMPLSSLTGSPVDFMGRKLTQKDKEKKEVNKDELRQILKDALEKKE